ncbi:hypothetical protein [Amycolatopsis pigmentata]|uniref:MYXO-CTERM domain-containing protein n=1 Tax=Amycolatopsis pigmentata TaxID=450801 RepID=A0ABW5G4Y9_9PSEU
MSVPEPVEPDTPAASRNERRQIVTRPQTARVDLAARWVRRHRAELAGVTAPTVLAATVSPWWAIGTGVAALLWATAEYRARQHLDRKEIES